MSKFITTNRHQQRLAIWVDNPTGKNGLVFIAHGLSSTHAHQHIEVYAQAFLQHDFVVVRHDATNSLGESGGELQDATLTNYYQDFEDVIAWASGQTWYREPFWLAGHSLGGACNLLFTVKHPDKIRALAPTSAFLSGEITLPAYGADTLAQWQKDGYRLEESKTRPGVIKRFNWSLVEDLQKYDLLPQAHLITAPTLLIVGEHDPLTPVASQQQLYATLASADKELHIIQGAPHTYMSAEHLREVQQIMSQWLESTLSEDGAHHQTAQR